MKKLILQQPATNSISFNSSLPNGKSWWNELIAALLPKGTVQLIHFFKKEMTSCCSCGEQWNQSIFFFFVGGLWAGTAANGSAQRRKQRRLIGDPSSFILFHQLRWLRRELKGLVGLFVDLLVMAAASGRGSANKEDKHSQTTNPATNNTSLLFFL